MGRKQKIFIPYQPSFCLDFSGYKELIYHNNVTMLFYQFEVGKKDKSVIIVPDGCIDILFCCGGIETEAFVCGSVLKGTKVNFKPDSQYYGVRILPGYCYMLLGHSAREFINREVSLVDIKPQAAAMLEQITIHSELKDIIKITNDILSLFEYQHKKLPLLIQYALLYINERNGGIKLEKLAEETGYSTRYINKIFQTYIGMNPKLFCRIIRFQHSLDYLLSQPQASLDELVELFNYYDQSHLLRDYCEFLCITPYKLLQKKMVNETSPCSDFSNTKGNVYSKLIVKEDNNKNILDLS